MSRSCPCPLSPTRKWTLLAGPLLWAPLLWLIIGEASAQGPDAPEVETLRTQGTDCYRQRDYACALEKFRKAYLLTPSPDMLFNLASAEDKLGFAVQAAAHFEEYVLTIGEKIEAPIQEHVQSRMSVLRGQIGQVTLQVKPAEATVTISGGRLGAPLILPRGRLNPDLGSDRVAFSRQSLFLEPGAYEIALALPAFKTARQPLPVTAGQQLRLVIHLEPEPPTPPGQRPAAPAATDPTPAAARPEGRLVRGERPRFIPPETYERSLEDAELQAKVGLQLLYTGATEPTAVYDATTKLIIPYQQRADQVSLAVLFQWVFFQRLQLGVRWAFLSHAAIAPDSPQSPSSAPAGAFLGMLDALLTAKILVWREPRWAVSAHTNFLLPTHLAYQSSGTSLMSPRYDAVGWRTGAAGAYTHRAFKAGADLSTYWFIEGSAHDYVGINLNLYGALCILSQAMPYLGLQIEFPAHVQSSSVGPAAQLQLGLQSQLARRFLLTLGAEVALNDSARTLFAMLGQARLLLTANVLF